MGWIAGAATSGTALAEVNTPPTGKSYVLKGVYYDVRSAAATAAQIELHVGAASSASQTTVVLGASTGGSNVIYDAKGLAKGKYIGVDVTSNVATSNSVLIWGDYE